ncbi:MAG: FAD-dependent oxidoreductase [Candidatus Woesearchaeota archaeon]
MARIVIIGAGFGGIEVARHLRDFDVTLINRSEKFVYHPSIPFYVSGKRTKKRFVFSLVKFAKKRGINFVKETVTKLDVKKKQVHTKDKKFEYDYLVLSTGSATNYRDIPGLQKNSIALKEQSDTLKKKLGEISSGTIIIGGGGMSGVEIAMEIREAMPEKVEVKILEAMHRILSQMPQKLSDKTTKFLEKANVSIETDAIITKVSKGRTHLKDKKILDFDLLVWCGGIKPAGIMKKTGLTSSPRGHLLTNQYLQSIDDANVYGLGDCASIINPSTGKPIPATAHNAMEQGKTVAENIRRSIINFDLEPYVPWDAPMILTLGSKTAVLTYKNWSIKGMPLRWMKDLIEVSYIATHR